MIKNFFRVALRNMANHKVFAAINLLGLTTGIAACLFILLYVSDELSYDTFYPNNENIYRMQLHGRLSGQEIYTTSTNSALAEALVTEIPEVQTATRLNTFGEWVFRKDDRVYAETEVVTADSNYFKVFHHHFTEGTADDALVGPNKVVLTEKLAKKYFEDEPAVGKSLLLGDEREEYIVTGVISDMPHNTHHHFEAILSMRSFPYMYNTDGAWLNNSYLTYYSLTPGASMEDVDEKLRPIVEQNASPVFKQYMGKTMAELEAAGGIYKYFSMPLLDIRLYSDLKDEPQPQGNIETVYILSAIGLFILLIACINFMNLSTAKYAGRAKEVGLRKTMGSTRNNLIGQFLAESLLYAVISALISIGIVVLLLPYFNQLTGKSLDAMQMLQPYNLFFLIMTVLFIGLLAGSYPAFYLTSFEITETLKGKIRSGLKSGKVRSVLVTFQFWISILLVICTAIVYQQINYMRDRNLGFDKEKVLMIQNMSRLGDNQTGFKNAIESNSMVSSVSFSNNALPGTNNTTIFRAEGDDADRIMGTYYVDEEYLQSLGLEINEGRFFSRDFPSDSMAAVINEAAVREFGWEHPLDEKVINFNGDEPFAMEVIGVVKDFNFESIKLNVRPLVIQRTHSGNILYVRYTGNDPHTLLTEVESEWNALASQEPIEYSFLDQEFDDMFRAEQRLGVVFTLFTGIAILIACLGLFGLASFVAEQRTKEIGVRKVMGATVWNIISDMSFSFIKLVIIAFLLSIVPAWYLMKTWLADFPARISIGVGVFLIGGLLAIAIAWLTVGYQSYKAARSNPVESLRYE